MVDNCYLCRMKNKVTLKELSKLLNVSVSTVSKSLNNSPEISQKTIIRVKELAELHNYRPNPTAVNLKSSKSGTIAVIVPDISNSFFAKVLAGIEEEAQKTGLQVITYISNESYQREKEITEMISYGFVDGVLIAPSKETLKEKEFNHLRDFLEYDIPMVFYDRVNVGLPVDKIGVDDKESIFEATRLFCEKGLNKIGLISSIKHLDVGGLRILGYKQAMKKYNNNVHIITSENARDLRVKIEQFLKPGVKAVICTDIVSTLLTARIAYEQKIVIPKDLKLIGYFDEDLAPYLSPSLSYIDQFPKTIGQTALQLLSSRIKNKAENPAPHNEFLKTNLVHLESTRFS